MQYLFMLNASGLYRLVKNHKYNLDITDYAKHVLSF